MAIEARTVLLEAIGDTRHARRELEQLERKLAGLDGDTEISVRAETNRANRRLGEFERRLKDIDRTKVSPEVSVEIGEALANLGEMRRRLTGLANRRTKVDVEFDRDALREVLEFERGLRRMSVSLERASRPARTFGNVLGDVVQSIKSVTPVVNGLAILIAIKLVSGLLAVGASAAAAVGGVLSLGAALLASLGPALALAIAVVSRISAVFDALKQQETAAKQAKQQALAGSSQNIAAARQEEAAARSIADAHRAAGDAAEEVSRATVAAYAEMEQAAEDVQEAIESVSRAEINLDQSQHDIEQAEQALKDFAKQADISEGIFKKFTDVNFQFDRGDLQGAIGPGVDAQDRLDLEQLILNVRRAKQDEKDATDDLADSERNLGNARRRQAEFQQQGLEASAQYVAAIEAQEDAQRNLRRAISDARAGHDALAASQAAAIVAADDLSGAERRLLVVLAELKKALREVFSGATNAVIGSLAGALDRMSILFLPLKGAIDELGDAWATLITTLSKEFVKPAWIGAFMAFFHLAAQLTRVIGGDAFVQFLRIVRNIALVAGPMLVDVFREFAGWLERVALATSDLGRSRSTIAIMVDGFRAWMGLIGGVLELLVALVDTVGPIGNEFVRWITRGVRAFTEWLKTAEGQEEVREFFEDTLPAVKSLIGFIFRLLKVFARVLQITSPLLKGFIDGLNFVLDLVLFLLGLLQDITHTPLVTWVLELVGSFLAFGTVLKLLRFVLRALLALPGGLVGLVKAVGKYLVKPFVDAFNGIIRLVARFAPNLAAKLQVAVLNAVKFVEKQLAAFVRLGGKLISKVGEGIKKGASVVFEIGKFIVTTLRRGVENLVRVIFGAGRWVVERIVNGVKSAASAVYSIGKSLLEGLVNGFTTIGKKAFGAIKGLVGKIVDAVKDFLGIHSPSRVFYNIGQDMLAGLIKGFSTGDVLGFIKDNLGGLPGLAAALAKKGLIDIPINVLGKLGGLGVDALEGVLPGLAKGGLVTSRIFAELGERGKEAVIPLTSKVLGQLADAIASSMRFPTAAAPGGFSLPGGAFAAPAPGGVTNFGDTHITLPPPAAGGTPDARYQAQQLARLYAGRGGR